LVVGRKSESESGAGGQKKQGFWRGTSGHGAKHLLCR
jgi:hypothetical protein